MTSPNPSSHSSQSTLLERDDAMKREFSIQQTIFGTISGKNVLFCIDTSGSILFALNAIKKHLLAVLFQISFTKQNKSVNVLEFYHQASMWKETMQPWTTENVRNCMNFVLKIGQENNGGFKSLFHALAKYNEIDSVYIVTAGFLSEQKSNVTKNIKRIMNGRNLNIIYISDSIHPDRDKTLYLKELTDLTQGIFTIILVEYLGNIEHVALMYNSVVCGKYLPRLTVNHRKHNIAALKQLVKEKPYFKNPDSTKEASGVFNPFAYSTFHPLDGEVDPLKEYLLVAASYVNDPETMQDSPFYGIQHHWYWPGYGNMPQRWWSGQPDMPFYKPYAAWQKLSKLNESLMNLDLSQYDPKFMHVAPSCHEIMIGKKVLVQMRRKILVFKFGIVRTPVVCSAEDMKNDEVGVQLCIDLEDPILLTNKNIIITTIDCIIDYDDNINNPVHTGDLILGPTFFHKTGRYEFAVVVSGEELRNTDQKGVRKNLVVEWILSQKRTELCPNTALKAHISWLTRNIPNCSRISNLLHIHPFLSLEEMASIITEYTRESEDGKTSPSDPANNPDDNNQNEYHLSPPLPPTPDLCVIDEMVQDLLHKRNQHNSARNGRNPYSWQRRDKSKWLSYEVDSDVEDDEEVASCEDAQLEDNRKILSEERTSVPSLHPYCESSNPMFIQDEQNIIESIKQSSSEKNQDESSLLLSTKCDGFEVSNLPTDSGIEPVKRSQKPGRLRWTEKNEIKSYTGNEVSTNSLRLEEPSVSRAPSICLQNMPLRFTNSRKSDLERNSCYNEKQVSGKRCSQKMYESMRALVNQSNDK